MEIEFFNSTGYTKMPKEEFWRRYDEKDDYILDSFEFCKQDPDGDVWAPNVEKLFELEMQDAELEFEEELELEKELNW